jgi:tripartite-type tricarboxylate transporter receptor subunit TctC
MRRILVGLVLVIVIAAGGGALGQNQYPAGTVRIIVPSSPGATTDVLARMIGQGLTQSWGQPVIVENRPGADEMIGVQAAAKAAADGYTLLVTSNAAITAAPHLHSRMSYDSQKDLTPILMLGQVTPVMNVPASLPVKSVQEFIALAKAKPGALNYGSFGNGTYAHVDMEDFKLRTGTQIVHIPYRGAAQAMTALLRSEIALLITNMGSVAAHVKAGTVRTIAAVGAQRSAMRPDLPTVAESGLPGFSTGAWWGLFGPANLPQPIVDKIRAEVTRILGTPEAGKLFETNTFELIKKSPEQFEQFIRDDLDNWARQIKAAGIKPD